MKNFRLIVWFFIGNQEEDFEEYDVIANSPEEAIDQAKEKFRFIKTIEIVKNV